MSIKNWSRIFVYVSIAFLLVYLIRTNKFEQIRIDNVALFGFSLIVLMGAFMLNPFRWWMINRFTDLPISFKLAVKSTGMSIMGKYIPGKFWMVVGKASLVAKETQYPIHSLLNNSFYSQILGVGTGLFFGIPFLTVLNQQLWLITYIIFVILFIVVAFKGIPYQLIPKRFSKLHERFASIQKLSGWQVLTLLAVFLVEWALVGIGFVLMANSVGSIDLAMGFTNICIFPFSSVMGIIAVFTPGGLGVREGMITFLLNQAESSDNAFVSLSALSRIWFLVCEIAMFLIGMTLSLMPSKRNPI